MPQRRKNYIHIASEIVFDGTFDLNPVIAEIRVNDDDTILALISDNAIDNSRAAVIVYRTTGLIAVFGSAAEIDALIPAEACSESDCSRELTRDYAGRVMTRIVVTKNRETLFLFKGGGAVITTSDYIGDCASGVDIVSPEEAKRRHPKFNYHNN